MIKQKSTRTCLQGEVGWTIVQGCSFKQVSSTRKRQKNSSQEVNWKRSKRSGAGVAPSNTYEFPPRIALWDLQLERQKKGLGDGAISILSKEGSRRCNSREREQISGRRGRWGGWKISIWGNWGWVFLIRRGLALKLFQPQMGQFT